MAGRISVLRVPTALWSLAVPVMFLVQEPGERPPASVLGEVWEDTLPQPPLPVAAPSRDSISRDSARRDSLRRRRAIRLPGAGASDSVPVQLPTLRTTASIYRRAAAEIAAARAMATQLNNRSVIEAAWGRITAQTLASAQPPRTLPGDNPALVPDEPARPVSRVEQFLENYADLSVQFDGRLELRGEKSETNRCQGYSFLNRNVACRSVFEPLLDFQYAVRSNGVVANRLHVDVDYDARREFDASNTISIAYEGGKSEFIRRFEVGNVTFQLPPSRFITAAIPSGNYGLQAITRLNNSGMQLRAIVAQQKGNVVRDRIFTMGQQALQVVDRTVDDYQFEPRRFFFTVDPARFSEYPNIDILNRQQMLRFSQSLPDTVRPVRLALYRLVIGGQPANPNGPQFRLIGDPRSRRGQVYELLREGVDYYADPSLLWISLVRPLSLTNERLVVAYYVRVNGVETVHATTGGTPDLEFEPSREQFANLLWDPQVEPGHPAFTREIRSVYRLGSDDVLRQSVSVKIVTGDATDQEKPLSGPGRTFLQLFGLAEPTNASTFDNENRLWPRTTDPNWSFGVGAFGQRTVRDQFLVFPSLQPFASGGMAGPANPHNDTIYTTPGEYLNTSLRPPAVYRLKLKYQSQGNGSDGTLILGAIQVRPGSERIVVDNVPVVRDLDYTIDYDLGRVTFERPDTLFVRPRQVVVQFEENPVFAETPTSIAGASLEIPLANGQLNFIALSQTQRTSYTRPTLGFEPQSTLIGGVNMLLNFDAQPLTRLVSRLTGQKSTVPSRISVAAEFAASKPQPNQRQQAYLESFEGEGGLPIRLDDQYWHYSSQPAVGSAFATRFGAATLDLERAATLAWQTNVLDERQQQQIRFSIDQIDPEVTLVGSGVAAPEQLLWMTLHPLSAGGFRKPDGTYGWQTGVTLSGRRWRSIRTALGPSGSDVSRTEHIEFWALVRTSAGSRGKNPVLVLDIGDVSENSVAYAPDSIHIRQIDGRRDTVMTGRQLQGFDELNSERDPFSRTFNAAVNDNGLPGDVARPVVVVYDTVPGRPPVVRRDTVFTTCRNQLGRLYAVGDARANCTTGNGRLDEEDIDGDNVLNFTSAERDAEQWRRYIVDLSSDRYYSRVGKCVAGTMLDPTAPPADSACWVHVRVPFATPDDSLNAPSLRRARAMRITMLSSGNVSDDEWSRVALNRLRLTGAPWFKRSDEALRGVGGETPANSGFVSVGSVGTQDRTLLGGVDYESPPGVTDVADTKGPIGGSRIPVNEHSLRMTASGLQVYDRAEAYYRFPEGQKNFMGYRELRAWARGVSNGWGNDGEMQFFIKIGRDASNFYMYRTPLNGGNGQSAWLPEIRLDFNRFITLRAAVQNAYLQNGVRNTCTGLDSVLIANTPLPPGIPASARYAACDDGYIVYTIDPAVSPPNLAAVQELAVGMVRVAVGTGTRPIAPADTLELWVDDIRLSGVVNAAGYAGHVGIGIIASDFADIRAAVTRRDPNFRQLGDHPTYATDNAIDFSAALHLEKLFSEDFGYSIPVSINVTNASSAPMYLTDSDLDGDAVPGLRIPRTSATSITFGFRRTKLIEGGGWRALLLNNLALNGTYTHAAARTEYQDGRAHDFRIGMDYNLTRALQESNTFRLAQLLPADLYLTTAYESGKDRRLSYLKPAYAPDDLPNIVGGARNIWRHGGALTIKPLSGGSVRLNLTSARDLRSYGNTDPGLAQARSRSTFLGLDLGAERARAVGTQLNYEPLILPWLRARFNMSSAYDMSRDINTLAYLVAIDSIDNPLVPRRIASTQHSSAGMVIDLPKLATMQGVPNSLRGVLRMLQPVDVNFDRNLLAAFDGTDKRASLDYQLGFVGLGRIKRLDDDHATSAGVSNQMTLSHNIVFPFGVVVTNRYQRLTLRNWVQQIDSTQNIGDGTQLNFPDIGIRWNSKFTAPGALIQSVSASARIVGTRQLFSSFGGGTPESANRGLMRLRNYPVSITTVWQGARPVTTSVNAVFVERLTTVPGLSGEGSGTDVSADISRAFPLPRDWNPRSDLRTRLSFQNSHDRSYVLNPLAIGRRSRLSDNGRRALSLSADTDVAENLTSSFVISRVSSFDRNLDRRFTQTVLSAVLHLQFYAGDLK